MRLAASAAHATSRPARDEGPVSAAPARARPTSDPMPNPPIVKSPTIPSTSAVMANPLPPSAIALPLLARTASLGLEDSRAGRPRLAEALRGPGRDGHGGRVLA